MTFSNRLFSKLLSCNSTPQVNKVKSHQFEEKCLFLTPQKLQVFIRLPLFSYIRIIFVREKGFSWKLYYVADLPVTCLRLLTNKPDNIAVPYASLRSLILLLSSIKLRFFFQHMKPCKNKSTFIWSKNGEKKLHVHIYTISETEKIHHCQLCRHNTRGWKIPLPTMSTYCNIHIHKTEKIMSIQHNMYIYSSFFLLILSPYSLVVFVTLTQVKTMLDW